jgi:hypothetical protein
MAMALIRSLQGLLPDIEPATDFAISQRKQWLAKAEFEDGMSGSAYENSALAVDSRSRLTRNRR